MPLEDELKARTLALLSQQMANWVVEIQKRIAEHQTSLVGKLDELQENVARYDEKIDEDAISRAIGEVFAANPGAASPSPVAETGPNVALLLSAMAQVDTGANLTEVLTSLVNESAKQVDRVAMFIIKGANAVGWYAKGFEVNEAVKQIQIPLANDTIFRTIQSDRAPVLFNPATTGQTAPSLQKMGSLGSSAIAAPMVLRDKLAAVLYCDTTGPMSDPQAAFIDGLVRFAAKTTDLLSFVPRTPGAHPPAPVVTANAPATRPAPPPLPPPPPAEGGTVMFTPSQMASMHATAPPPAPPPPPPPAAPKPDGAGTVMFTASQMDQMRQQMSQMKPAPAPAAPALSPEETKAHEDAKRFARLIVSEIKLYNEAKVTEGRKAKDLSSRLKEDIDRGRQMYHDRISPGLRNNTNYFHDELVRLLAGGDPAALGPM